MDDELKPCPFCGSDEISHGHVDYGAQGYGNVECHTCDALVTADTEAEAIAVWNTRADDAELTRLHARVAELEGEMARRDRNEARNCINWGPCSMRDGPMTEPEASHD
jgi:Lar family restriction alleviation protein